MTLNNSRQKVNDALGNPVVIAIAVMWRVNDTVKAVFNVDNFKEYLSLQCDSAVRNIVRIYPYDIGRGSIPLEMALEKLSENDVVKLDEERKAAMVSNLLVVLCGSKDAQPIVNSGSLY